jgi:hypothetical protein
MLQGTALVQANTLTPKAGEAPKADKNGLQSIILTPIAGAIPGNRTISGTIADGLKIVDGGVYLVDYNERDPYVAPDGRKVRNFQWMNLSADEKLSALDILKAKKDLGVSKVIPMDAAATVADPNTPNP